MTPVQKKLVINLLIGYCLVKHYTHNRNWCYRLIDTAGTTEELLQLRTVEKLRRYAPYKKKLLKKDSIGRLTLNLNIVRQLHGRSTIKQLYYRREELKNTGSVHKKRNIKDRIVVPADTPTLF